MEDQKEIQEASPVLTSFVEWFISKYKPAATFAEADLFLTTSELYTQVTSFFPIDISKEQLFTLLLDNGFRYDTDVEQRFCWLLITAK